MNCTAYVSSGTATAAVRRTNSTVSLWLRVRDGFELDQRQARAGPCRRSSRRVRRKVGSRLKAYSSRLGTPSPSGSAFKPADRIYRRAGPGVK